MSLRFLDYLPLLGVFPSLLRVRHKSQMEFPVGRSLPTINKVTAVRVIGGPRLADRASLLLLR